MYLIYLLRRDLRLADNPIFHALGGGGKNNKPKYTHLLPLYVFQPNQIDVSGFLDNENSTGSGSSSTDSSSSNNTTSSSLAKSYSEKSKSRIGGFPRCGPHRCKFLAEALCDLKGRIRKDYGSDLVFRVGDPAEVVAELLEGFEKSGGTVGGVWMTRDWASEEMEDEKRVQGVVLSAGKKSGANVEWKVWDGEEMLIHNDDLKMHPNHVPDVFTSFRKRVEPLRSHIRNPYPPPSSLPPLPPSIPSQPKPFIIPDKPQTLLAALHAPFKDTPLPPPFPKGAHNAHPFIGGETHAHSRLLHLLKSGSMSRYKDTRNGLIGEDFSTKLSGYLAQGSISARQINSYLVALEDGEPIYPQLYTLSHSGGTIDIAGSLGYGKGENKGTAGVRFELLWRDYMRLCLRKYGDRLFSLSGFQDPKSGTREEAEAWWQPLSSCRLTFQRWQEGTTGSGLVDASMRELACTGYTSNRARQNCASFLASKLKIDWRAGAEWYECMLVDYDVASNWGNWAYVAGVGNDPRSVEMGGRAFNQVKQGFDYDPQGEYVRTWVQELKGVRDVGVVMQGWKAVSGGSGPHSPEEQEALERLKGVSWVRNPLVKINWSKSGKGGGGGREKHFRKGRQEA